MHCRIIAALSSFAAIASSAAAQTSPASPLPTPLAWTASGPLVMPPSDAAHPNLAIKDPSVVRYDGRWHVFATTADGKGWSMVYLNFADWKDANAAKPFFMDQNPGLRGYHCAPQVFYFAPQQKWYLIFQSQQPQFCTSADLTDGMSWTKPQDFFPDKPPIIKDLWLDFWIICDDARAYLFFTGDNGKLYRSSTPLDQFPRGMTAPVIVMEDKDRVHLFEGGATYKLKDSGRYLTIVEAIGPNNSRYYRSFVADRLDGEWTPVADTFEHPFAGIDNVRFAPGVEPWTRDISHGELIRENYDQTPTVDPAYLQFLFQGRDPNGAPVEYGKLPYRLGLLTLDAPAATTKPAE